MENTSGMKKMKILCLHGFRTSGSFLKKQIGKWDPSIFAHFDLVFPDGIFPAGGKSEIEGVYPPPYFEWFQFNPDFTEYKNLDECISYLCEYITTNGPFDGLLGFSQGATLSALLMGYQAQGKLLKDHPPMKLLVSISGSKFRDPRICEVAYKDPIKVKSVHFVGAKDWLKLPSEDLATAFENPLIIRHPQGHTVPRLDEAAVEQLRSLTTSIVQSDVASAGQCVENGKAELTATRAEEPNQRENVSEDKIQPMNASITHGTAGDGEHGIENGQTGLTEIKAEDTSKIKKIAQNPLEPKTQEEIKQIS